MIYGLCGRAPCRAQASFQGEKSLAVRCLGSELLQHCGRVLHGSPLLFIYVMIECPRDSFVSRVQLF